MSKQKQDLSVEETEEEFITRLTQPRIWSTLGTNYFIQSMPEERLEEVLNLFKVGFFSTWRLCNIMCLHDKRFTLHGVFLFLFFLFCRVIMCAKKCCAKIVAWRMIKSLLINFWTSSRLGF